MMEKIKIIERKGILETNSSTSHSVCISMSGDELSKEYWDLPVQNGCLYLDYRDVINEEYYFRDLNKVLRTCYEKLVYLSSIMCRDVASFYGLKRIKKFKNLVKRIFGISEVYIYGVDNYFLELERRQPGFSYYLYDEKDMLMDEFHYGLPIDYGVEDEICESFDTIKSFLLSPSSCLYDDHFYQTDETEKYTLKSDKVPVSVDFGEGFKIVSRSKVLSDNLIIRSDDEYTPSNRCKLFSDYSEYDLQKEKIVKSSHFSSWSKDDPNKLSYSGYVVINTRYYVLYLKQQQYTGLDLDSRAHSTNNILNLCSDINSGVIGVESLDLDIIKSLFNSFYFSWIKDDDIKIKIFKILLEAGCDDCPFRLFPMKINFGNRLGGLVI